MVARCRNLTWFKTYSGLMLNTENILKGNWCWQRMLTRCKIPTIELKLPKLIRFIHTHVKFAGYINMRSLFTWGTLLTVQTMKISKQSLTWLILNSFFGVNSFAYMFHDCTRIHVSFYMMKQNQTLFLKTYRTVWKNKSNGCQKRSSKATGS